MERFLFSSALETLMPMANVINCERGGKMMNPLGIIIMYTPSAKIKVESIHTLSICILKYSNKIIFKNYNKFLLISQIIFFFCERKCKALNFTLLHIVLQMGSFEPQENLCRSFPVL